MPGPERNVYRSSTRTLSAVMLLLGVAMLISTLARGGGVLSIGVIMGLLFLAAGGGRLYVSLKGS
ncbi:MAG: hypothetical protein JWM31_67 [Solirubrobacterales bacterium]|nr:hypothetical protein [Solirubrobacterales bacterium]